MAIEKLSDRDFSESVLIAKINELIDVVNDLRIGNDHYDPQAEEALKQIAELESKFNNHVHYARELQMSTSTPDNPNVFE